MIKELYHRARFILSTEGLFSLLRHSSIFTLSYIFRYETFGIWMHFPQAVTKLDAAAFATVPGHAAFIVENNAEADDLESRGYEFRSRVFRATEALFHGGTAIVVFIDYDIASITWIARNARVQRIFDNPPRKVAYDGGETFICGSETFPRYRRKGLYTYTLLRSLQYLASIGDKVSISVTAVGLPIFGISRKLFSSKLTGYAHWLRILGMDFYWERPVPGP